MQTCLKSVRIDKLAVLILGRTGSYTGRLKIFRRPVFILYLLSFKEYFATHHFPRRHSFMYEKSRLKSQAAFFT
ncbi:hypothetical protein PL75_05280 [Neisseria arctica]|uniref:Uncharacterized protein n=1 Tax=Neisseria arctica TaxID=1470200 RepID=A0A0J1C463_9NEIS|nr:hypothetical protein PL75_05280 [Neisseria arctica]